MVNQPMESKREVIQKKIIITDIALNLSADLLFLEIIHITKDFDP